MEVQVINEGPKIKNTKVGDIIRVKETNEDDISSWLEYKVTEVYSYIVRAKAKRGRKNRCFSYGDLVKLGMEPQWQGKITHEYEAGNKGARYNYPRTACGE